MMPLDLTAALAVFLSVLGWMLIRRRSQRTTGPFLDVPDAPGDATPIEAPGVTPPYSSLDPTAPPKRFD
jgi:hypothetical protein